MKADDVPTVSVVIPCYNASKTLPATLESVFRQTLSPLEIVVIDDASTDVTPLLAELQDSRIVYDRLPKNSGGSNARNRGVDLARGDWIAFLDADDLWHPSKLEVQLRSIARASSEVVCVTNFQKVNGEGHVLGANRRPLRPGERVEDYLFASDGNSLQCSSFVMSRKTALEVRFRQETAPHDDWDVLVRAQRSGREVLYIPEVLVYYLDHNLHSRVSKVRDTGPSERWVREQMPFLSRKAKVGIYLNTLYSRGYYNKRPIFMLKQLWAAYMLGILSTKRFIGHNIRIIFGDAVVQKVQLAMFKKNRK